MKNFLVNPLQHSDILMAARCVTEAFKSHQELMSGEAPGPTCAVHIEDCESTVCTSQVSATEL